MKHLIFLALLAAGCASAPSARTAVAKTSVANGQFKGADHMPPEALAAKKAAGP